MSTVCDYDSGAATGCQPLCDDPARWEITYRNGSSGPLTARVCDWHKPRTLNRLYPTVGTVVELGGAS